MKPLKIEKTVVEAKTRTLKATWTVEAADEVLASYGLDLEKELKRFLQDEIDREILETLGWIRVTVENWERVDQEWCKRYIKGKYRSFTNFWLFEKQEDANFFTLKWSSE